MLKRTRPELPPGCISDLRFEALRVAELTRAQEDELRAHCASCLRCGERRRLLEQELTAIEARLPAWSSRAQPTNAASPLRRHAPWLTGLALAACALLLALPRFDRDTIRTKGGPSFGFFVKRGALVFEGSDDEQVHPGDVLRFVVTPQGARYVAILSRTASGEASVYYPAGDSAASVAEDAQRVALDSATELDQSLGDEQLIALFCSRPFQTEPVRLELAQRGALQTMAGCSTATQRIHKRAAP